MVAFPPFRLDTDEERLWKGETLLALRRKPFAILRYLVAHPKKLVTHEELLAQVWGRTAVSESAVRSHLHELRTVLGDGVIETVIGRGYRFMAELADDVVVRDPHPVAQVDPLVVGRDAELAALRGAFDRAVGGRRQMCFVTGEPGIGKSTLVANFLAGLDSRAIVVGRGQCIEQHGTAEAYLAMIEALGGLTRSMRGPQVLAALVRYAPTFVAQVPHLVSDEQLAEVTRRAGGGNESKMVRELSEALEAMCGQDPMVIVLEDLQWSDVATIDLLSLLGQRQERAKLLVIATSRHAEIQSPDHPLNRVMRSLVARSGALAVQVPRIGVATVKSFIDRRFVGHAFPDRLAEVVATITGGTPLFMVSLLDDLAARGMLAERDGRWILTVALDQVEAHRPDSVKQLIDIQLDRLSPAEQRVLEAASVVGAEFSTNLVAAALEVPDEEIDETCDALARRSLFLRAEPGGRYAVTHALVQEVCGERSVPARRQRWHRLVAEAIERERPAEASHLLAKHYDAGQVPSRAIPAYVAAGHQTALRFASTDALILYGRALDLLPRLPPGKERDVTELDILGTVGQLLIRSSTNLVGREPLSIYKRAIEIARALDDGPALYAALSHLAIHYMVVAAYDLSAELSPELERIEQTHQLETPLLHYGMNARAITAFYRGELATALRLFEALVASEPIAAAQTGLIHTSALHGAAPRKAMSTAYLSNVTWLLGDPDRSLSSANAAVAAAAELDDPLALGMTQVSRLRSYFLRRDPAPLIEDAASTMVGSATAGKWVLEEARTFVLWARAQRAPLELTAIEPMLESFRLRISRVSMAATLVAQVLIDVLRRSGHLAEARALTDEIIAFALSRNERVYLPELIRLRGEQLEASDPAAAADAFRDAIERARLTGAVSLEQRAAASLAALSSGPR